MKTYVIHVSTAVERRAAIENELEGKNFDTTFILDGDIHTLDESRINIFFAGKMRQAQPSTSCSFKHILAYQKIVEEKHQLAHILEDDIRFYSNSHLLNNIASEIKHRDLSSFMVSLEDSRLKYIPRSKRKEGLYLYTEQSGRMTGAYLIDYEGAKRILAHLEKEKMNVPIDWFHNQCVDKNIIHMFWAQPTLAVQGSLEGSIKSLIGKVRFGFLKVISFRTQRTYKRFIAFLK